MQDRGQASLRSILRRTLRNPDILRLEASWAIGFGADWAVLVGLLVVAYDAGGTLGVALLGLARMAPATIVALGMVGQGRPETVLVAVNFVRLGASLAVVALLVVGGPVELVFVAAGVIGGAGALIRPAVNVLLPALATSPEDLVAANTATTTGENLGTFLGPLLGGVLLAFGGPTPATVVGAAGFLVAAAATARIRVAEAARTAPVEAGRLPVVAGIRALRDRPRTGVAMLAFLAQLVVRGLLGTLTVVAAIELFGLGEPGVGILNAAIGAGGIVGSVVSLTLARRARLAPAAAVSLVGWGLPIAVVGAWPGPLQALAAFAVVGLSNATLDVAGFSLLQRTIGASRRAAVFAVLEGVAGVGIAFGGLLAPVLVAGLGLRGALGVTGAILPIVAVMTWPWISRLDDDSIVPERELRLLRRVRLFEPLPMTALEALAGALEPVRYETAEILMAEGDEGDLYVLIAEGVVDVSSGGRSMGHAGPGEGIGEIALLRRSRRTATVIAREPVEAYALRRQAFLAAVTGHAGSTAAADEVVTDRLARSARG